MASQLPAPGGAPPSGQPGAGSSPESAPALLLEIADGREAARTVAVRGPRAVLGGHAACDVCLGEAFPPLHSILIVEGETVWLEAVFGDPPLRVNGRRCGEARLADGDVVELGHVRIVVRFSGLAALEQPPGSHASAMPGGDEGVPSREVSRLSAAELVEAIEREDDLVSEFESRRAAGLDALLDAAFSRGIAPEASRPETAPSPIRLRVVGTSDDAEIAHGDNFPAPRLAIDVGDPADPGSLQQLEDVVEVLNRFADELNERGRRLASRERALAEAAETLLETQQRLCEQVDGALERIAALESGRSAMPARNVA